MPKKILQLFLKCIAIITLVAVGVFTGLFAFDRLVVQPENNRTAAAVLATLPTDVALLELVDRQHKNPLADRLYASLIYKNGLIFADNTLASDVKNHDFDMQLGYVDALCRMNLFLKQYRPYALQQYYPNGDFRSFGSLNFVFTEDKEREPNTYRIAMSMQPYYLQRLREEVKQIGKHNAQHINCLLEMDGLL